MSFIYEKQLADALEKIGSDYNQKYKMGQQAEVAPTSSAQLYALTQSLISNIRSQATNIKSETGKPANVFMEDLKDLPSLLHFLYINKMQSNGMLIVRPHEEGMMKSEHGYGDEGSVPERQKEFYTKYPKPTEAAPEAYKYDVFKAGLIDYLKERKQEASDSKNELATLALNKLIDQSDSELQLNYNAATTPKPAAPGAASPGTNTNTNGVPGVKNVSTGPGGTGQSNKQEMAKTIRTWLSGHDPLRSDVIDLTAIQLFFSNVKQSVAANGKNMAVALGGEFGVDPSDPIINAKIQVLASMAATGTQFAEKVASIINTTLIAKNNIQTWRAVDSSLMKSGMNGASNVRNFTEFTTKMLEAVLNVERELVDNNEYIQKQNVLLHDYSTGWVSILTNIGREAGQAGPR